MEFEESFKRFAAIVALLVEAGTVLLVLVGAVEALVELFRSRIRGRRVGPFHDRGVWQRFARWLILALEFALAADIVRTAISPTWNDIGQLGAIAAIRTGLNYFLERDVEHTADQPQTQLQGPPPDAAPLDATVGGERIRRDARASERSEHVPA